MTTASANGDYVVTKTAEYTGRQRVGITFVLRVDSEHDNTSIESYTEHPYCDLVQLDLLYFIIYTLRFCSQPIQRAWCLSLFYRGDGTHQLVSTALLVDKTWVSKEFEISLVACASVQQHCLG